MYKTMMMTEESGNLEVFVLWRSLLFLLLPWDEDKDEDLLSAESAGLGKSSMGCVVTYVENG